MSRTSLLCVALSGLLASSCALAQVKPEDALAYRKSAFGLIVWNFGPMSGMVRGKLPWDDAEFAKRAARVAQLAPMLEEGFPQGSKVGDSAASAEIWSNWADFQSKMLSFQTEAAKLAQVASGSDAEATKAQFGKVGAACKACHDKYKED
jgi:cytochrome c556